MASEIRSESPRVGSHPALQQQSSQDATPRPRLMNTFEVMQPPPPPQPPGPSRLQALVQPFARLLSKPQKPLWKMQENYKQLKSSHRNNIKQALANIEGTRGTEPMSAEQQACLISFLTRLPQDLLQGKFADIWAYALPDTMTPNQQTWILDAVSTIRSKTNEALARQPRDSFERVASRLTAAHVGQFLWSIKALADDAITSSERDWTSLGLWDSEDLVLSYLESNVDSSDSRACLNVLREHHATYAAQLQSAIGFAAPQTGYDEMLASHMLTKGIDTNALG